MDEQLHNNHSNLLRFCEGDNYVEITIALEEDASLQSHGDAYLTIEVNSNGFRGHNDLWVFAKSLECFCKELISLENNRAGNAELESISPNELHIKVHSINSRGHMAISGKTGYLIPQENKSFWHNIEFGFEFDPSQLVLATKIWWVAKHKK
jgi:hypothetical protein